MSEELLQQTDIEELFAAERTKVARAEEKRGARRHAFSVSQLIAPCDDQVLQALPTFRPARFRDLSTSGVGFVWPGEPEFDSVLLLLSNSEMALTTLAEVVRYEKIDGAGAGSGYLVGCRLSEVLSKGTLE